jgi:hypothetical protein
MPFHLVGLTLKAAAVLVDAAGVPMLHIEEQEFCH